MVQAGFVALIFIIFLWLIAVTLILWKVRSHYQYLVQDVDQKTLPAILEGIIRDTNGNKKAIQELTKRYDTIEKEGKSHIQKIGLLRFNPFKDTGGDQSFILTLVDAHNTGVIISGLYSRSGTRWYAKKVVKGRGHEHELSDEEKKALKLAQPIVHQ